MSTHFILWSAECINNGNISITLKECLESTKGI